MHINSSYRPDASIGYNNADTDGEIGPSALGAIFKAARVLAQVRSVIPMCLRS